ncbi:MAG: hypothetical protein EZS28_016484 [Streblomastix strix]|uniref:Uncharacterized protein n=1 Tax=Streblomastix strix TaxID=222440 RepID=A0A5J4VZ99_9EUKA|nr:MAG: hypothetical protein EZS28_016484 [Streblomastix strix]
MSLLRKGKLPYLHSPLPMIQATLNKDREENDATLIEAPNWPSQSWWPSLMELSNNYVNRVKSADVLKPWGTMRKDKKHLPPGKLIAVRLEVTEERNCSNGYFRKGNSLMIQYNQLLIDGIAFGAVIGKEQENLKNSGLNLETNLCTSYKCQFECTQNSNWDAIQDLRLPRGETKSGFTKAAYEKTSYSNKEVEKGRTNLQSVSSHDGRQCMAFKYFNLESWFELRREEDQDKSLQRRLKIKKISSYENLSKVVLIIMQASGINKEKLVTSITKSSITKSIELGAIIQETNRASRHKNGPSTVAVHYQMNLNDTVRE